MGTHPVYLWTLPMFHCNGWCFPWSLSVVAGTHVCLRWVRAGPMYDAIADHRVTHLCGAPIVMSTLLNAPSPRRRRCPHTIEFVTAAAPPPQAVLDAMTAAGFHVTHLYGLTETYGPAVVNEWHVEWNGLDAAERRRRRRARACAIRRSRTSTSWIRTPCSRCRPTAQTLGEVMFRGNIVMKGYLKNKPATDEAFAGGWFHSGDLGVMHPDGYIQLKDRSKDIIISGGENISSIEVEDVLYKHPAVRRSRSSPSPTRNGARRPAPSSSCKPGATASDDRADRLVPRAARLLQVPAPHRVRRAAEDLDGQDPEVQAAGAGEGGVRGRGPWPRSTLGRVISWAV